MKYIMSNSDPLFTQNNVYHLLEQICEVLSIRYRIIKKFDTGPCKLARLEELNVVIQLIARLRDEIHEGAHIENIARELVKNEKSRI